MASQRIRSSNSFVRQLDPRLRRYDDQIDDFFNPGLASTNSFSPAMLGLIEMLVGSGIVAGYVTEFCCEADSHRELTERGTARRSAAAGRCHRGVPARCIGRSTDDTDGRAD